MAQWVYGKLEDILPYLKEYANEFVGEFDLFGIAMELLEYSPEHNGFIEVGLDWVDVFQRHEVIR